MKKVKISAIAAMLILSIFLQTIPALCQDQVTGGQVTIPLDQFLKLIKTNNNQNSTPQIPPPPVTLLFGIADLNVTPLKDALQVECKVPFQLFQWGWNEITLMSDQVALKQVMVDGENVTLYSKESKHTILYKGTGKHTLELVYLVPTEKKGNNTVSSLYLPPSSTSNITLTVPNTGINIDVKPSMGGSSVEKDKKTIFTGTLPRGEMAQVSWTSVSAPTETGVSNTNLKPKIYAQVHDLISVSVGAVRLTSLIDLSIIRGQTDTFSFLLPKDVEVLDVKNDKLQGWSMEDKKDGKEVTVTLTSKVDGTQQITIVYEKPLKEISSVWTVPFLQVMGVEQEKGFIACEAKTSLEMKATEEQDITRVDTKELPSALVNLASTPVMLAYRYYKHPFILSIETTKYEELPVLSATIDTAQAMTFINDDGVSLTKLIYQMKNNQMQFLKITLPEGAEILNAFVAGAPVKPVKPNDGKEKNTVLIPLKKSESAQNAGLDAFAIEISYKSKTGGFSFMGKTKEILPACNVQISEYYWTIYLPKDKRVLGLSGDMKQNDESSTPPGSVRDDRIVSKVSQEVELQDTKKITGEINAPQAQQQQNMIQNFTNSSLAGDSGKVSGILPVELYIPQSGQVLNFKKLIVEEGKSLSIGATYIGESFMKTFCWLLLIAAFLLLIIPVRKYGFNRNSLLPAAVLLLIAFFLRIKLSDAFSYTLEGIILAVIYMVISAFITTKFPSRARKVREDNPRNDTVDEL